jgi:two-component system, LytTR family, response regulator
MKLRSIILDDEQHCIDTLQWQLDKYIPKIELINKFNSPTKALEMLNSQPIDLLFLDIEMPEMNGFELLKQINSVDFDIIFTTAYDEFAVNAFKASAIDYLLKPIDKNDLIKAVNKVVTKQKKQILPEQMDILYNALSNQKPAKERIAVPTNDGLHFIKTKEVMYCISDSNYTNIHLDGGQKVLICRTLKEIESLLEEVGFLRIHNSHLINLQKIEKYVRGDGGYVIMDDKKMLNVSRSRKEALLAAFGY